jgi:hypothetical protein
MRVRVCVSERVMTYETKKVQPSVGVFCALEAREDGLVFVKLALLDLNVDPDDILPHDASRPNIQVSVFSSIGQRNLGEESTEQTRLPSFP